MKVLYITDADDKYGASKSLEEMILNMKKKYDVHPIVLTSRKNGVNLFCDKNGIENYVTHHQKYKYVVTRNFLNDSIKFFPRYLRYIFGNLIALKKIKKYINMNEIDFIHTNISAIDFGCLLAKKYKKKHIMHLREFR